MNVRIFTEDLHYAHIFKDTTLFPVITGIFLLQYNYNRILFVRSALLNMLMLSSEIIVTWQKQFLQPVGNESWNFRRNIFS